MTFQTIVRGDTKFRNEFNGIPKTSHVARSNSLRSSSPPRMRRDYRPNANIPPAVPEGEVLNLPQYPSANRPPYVSVRTISLYYLEPICSCHNHYQIIPRRWQKIRFIFQSGDGLPLKKSKKLLILVCPRNKNAWFPVWPPFCC